MADKKKKNKNQKKYSSKMIKKKVIASVPTEWYYMASEEMSVEDIMEIVKDDNYDIHVWKEMGILEIGFAGEESGSLDVEVCDLDLGDEYSNEFLEEHMVKSLFYLTFKAEDEANALQIMKKLVQDNRGICCGDTDDFSPVIS